MKRTRRDRKKYAIHEETNETIQKKRSNTRQPYLKKWAPGANILAQYLAEGRDSFNSGGKIGGREGNGNDQRRANKVTMIKIYLTKKKKKKKRTDKKRSSQT